jgi:hypothetical protein
VVCRTFGLAGWDRRGEISIWSICQPLLPLTEDLIRLAIWPTVTPLKGECFTKDINVLRR